MCNKENKIRLLIIAPQLGIGGAETLVKDVFINVDRQKFEVKLLVFDYGHESLYNELVEQGYKIEVLDKSNISRLSFVLKVIKAIRSFKPHTITTWGWLGTAHSRLPALLAGFPRIVPQINSDIFVGTETGKISFLLKLLLLIETVMGRLNSGLIVISRSIAEMVSRSLHMPMDRITIVYCGVDTDYFSPQEPCNEMKFNFGVPAAAKVISIVGRLAAVKNHKMFIRMAAQVAQKYPEAYFLIVGPDWPCDYGEVSDNGEPAKNIDVLKKLAADLGVEDKVIFTGASREIKKILSITDVFVMTSSYEGLNNSILEAMSMGKPVIATKVGGMAESIIDGVCGYYVQADDHVSMAEKVSKLLDNETLRKDFGRKARQNCLDRFSIPVMMRQKEAVYEKSAGGFYSLGNLLRSGFAFKFENER